MQVVGILVNWHSSTGILTRTAPVILVKTSRSSQQYCTEVFKSGAQKPAPIMPRRASFYLRIPARLRKSKFMEVWETKNRSFGSIYVYIYTYVYIYIHICICIYICVYTAAQDISVYKYLHVCYVEYICINIYHIYVYVYMFVFVMELCVFVIHAKTYDIYMYVYIYACVYIVKHIFCM